ncbi:MAG TPA: aminotransferase class I/II-fold pyridoxal phosphate-dependent enzyme [Gemmataceae bacterium]|nr:aminotransferase class I/II-fold pyridoxal phosphate-dependent enzyme [Gemmataceae bacterium]
MPPSDKSPLGKTKPLVTPIYQSSVYSIPDLDALDAIMNDGQPGFIYARDAHPNARQLGKMLAQIESAEWGVITGSGMAAISAIVLATVQQGQRVLASNRLYGRTVQLFTQELSRFGVAADYVDCNDLKAVETALSRPSPSGRGVGGEGPKLLFVETMSNPLVRVVDIAALAELAHDAGALLVVDNTFATPVLTKPMDLGADFVMESLTKMIAGHSDVTLGLVCGNDADMLPAINTAVSIWGLSSNPFDCWLTERGLPTLDLRMRAACENARALADWLAEQAGVSRVWYPSRPDHPDRAIAERVLQGGFGHMLCFELEGGRDAVNDFIHAAPGIPFSPSLGHATTTLSHPATTSHRYVSPKEKARQGISDGLIRLSVGVEPLAAIQKEMAKGLQ